MLEITPLPFSQAKIVCNGKTIYVNHETVKRILLKAFVKGWHVLKVPEYPETLIYFQ